MRAGAWVGAVSTDNARVTLAGSVVPSYRIKKVSIQSGMRDGHPASETGASWCVEATIEWADPQDVTADAPEPFSGESWLPEPGATVVIETGDGALDQWWVQHRGVVDDTTGSLADGTAVTTTVDRIEDLSGRVTAGAILAKQPPYSNASTYREVGMQSTYLVDRFLRRVQGDTGVGWNATPDRTWETIGSTPNMGSLWPEVGMLTDTGTSAPAWGSSSYGVYPANFTADYNLISGTATEVIVSFAIITGGSTSSTLYVVDGDTKGVRIGYDPASNTVTFGTWGVAGGASFSIPRGGATRAALHFKRNTTTSQTLTVRLSTGAESTQATSATDYPTGWSATRALVRATSGGRIGWWMVEGDKPADPAYRWATLNSTAKARIRVGAMPWWRASRTVSFAVVSEWLAEQVDAECAAMWLDEDDVMQWAGRGVLEAQSPAQTVTTALDVDDIQWESRRRSMARSVWVSYLDGRIDMGYQGQITRNLWENADCDLGPGETEVFTVTTPDDEDWLQVDTSPHKVDSWANSSDWYRLGSIYGGTRYNDANGEGQAWEPFIGCTINRVNSGTLEVTVNTSASIPGSQRTKTIMPKDANAFSRLNNPALVLRGRARTKWVEAERSASAGASSGQSRYNHDVSWRVQDHSGELDLLVNFLRDVVGSTNPTVTGLVLSHDPRRQIGDKVRVEDRHVTGLWIDVLVQQRDTDTDAMTDGITGRVTAWGQIAGLGLTHPAGHTALTPASNWNREVA